MMNKLANTLAICMIVASGGVLAAEDAAKGPPCKVLSELDGVSVVVSIFGLDDCWEYSGTLDLYQDTAFKAGGKEVIIPAGLRAAVLKQETDRTLALVADVDLDEQILPIRVPRGFELPYEGEIYLASDQTGQPMDIRGTILVEQEQSEEYSAIENCSYSVLEYVSTDEGTYCRTANYDDGEFRARYYFMVTETQLWLEFLVSGGSPSLGNFSSSIFEQDKVYTYQSTCFQRRQDDWRC